ncbi:MAG TPA: tetratricopeptide repeat protein, partial [Pyrinomonadaceae bacterium]|nr:tetratricopeptide repeat protein [Pyrinomonadaceae bacterium]
ALRLLSDIRLRAGDAKEALDLIKRATNDTEAPLATWVLRAVAERATGDNLAALASLNRVLEREPNNLSALLERAELRLASGDKAGALQDLAAAEPLIKDNKNRSSRLAAAYELAGKPEEAQRIATAAGLITPGEKTADGSIKVIGTPAEIAEANHDDPAISRKGLEHLLTKNPDNPMLMARLGDSYRTVDPLQSLEFYRRAIQLQPNNVNIAVGYSSALVQARRFNDAATILRKVIAIAPDNYTAHANLATALYALKDFSSALVEYDWLLKAKPDLSVALFFIATAHDNLGEYEQALTAYENFITRADPKTNQLEIEKVKLRLPTLRRQIQLGEGVKQKTGQTRKP